ncbi:MAG: hypothetical protein PHF37_03105 [Phycisphaerae bacterium]|nr:hypothetical protein [Phycisphaerae bacterium]
MKTVSAEDNKEWGKMVREILAAKDLKYGCRLSAWEINFLTDMTERACFSRPMGDKIEKIYRAKMP